MKQTKEHIICEAILGLIERYDYTYEEAIYNLSKVLPQTEKEILAIWSYYMDEVSNYS